MTSRFMFAVAVLVGFSAIWCGCGRLDANTVLTKIPGTEGVDVWHPALSISPDGNFMVIVADYDKYENNGHRFDYQIESLEISTGKIRRHRPSANMDQEALDWISRTRTTIGWSDFQEECWNDGKFFIWKIECYEFDPNQDEYLIVNDGSNGCTNHQNSSDTVEREFLFEVEKKFRERGTLKDSDYYSIFARGAFEVRHLSVPASVDRSKPVLYYVGAKSGIDVYCSNGKESERVYRCGGIFYTRGITKIKASPDGRYLAIVRRKVFGSPVPVPASGFDLTILDMERDKKFVLKTSMIGSCVWAPDSKTLYLACSDDGDGVYRLEISDAFH